MKRLFKRVKANDGFTYLDVIVAFILFGMMFVFVARMSQSIYFLNDQSTYESQMVHLAELELDNYRTGINQINIFLAHTGFTIDSETIDDENVINRVLSLDNVENRYRVQIEETFVRENVSKVIVTVSIPGSEVRPISLTAQLIKDS